MVKGYRKQLRQRGLVDTPRRGTVYVLLRRSPMVGAGIKFRRKVTRGRKVDI